MLDHEIDPPIDTPEQQANEAGAERHEQELQRVTSAVNFYYRRSEPRINIESSLDGDYDGYEEASVRVCLLPCDDMLGTLAEVLRRVADEIERPKR